MINQEQIAIYRPKSSSAKPSNNVSAANNITAPAGYAAKRTYMQLAIKRCRAVRCIINAKITKKCMELNLSTYARIIVHDIEFLNIQLAEGQYFFTDIKKEGFLLYDSGNHKLARKRKLKPHEQQRIMQDHFDHWYESATEFWEYFEIGLSKKQYKKAAFMLNQTAESCYKAILLVFTNYNPREHYLRFLNAKAGKYNKAIKQLFKAKTEKEQSLFDLLDYAYIGARYDAGYRIEKEELEFLSEKVQALLKITEEMCREKIGSFAK